MKENFCILSETKIEKENPNSPCKNYPSHPTQKVTSKGKVSIQ